MVTLSVFRKSIESGERTGKPMGPKGPVGPDGPGGPGGPCGQNKLNISEQFD